MTNKYKKYKIIDEIFIVYITFKIYLRNDNSKKYINKCILCVLRN